MVGGAGGQRNNLTLVYENGLASPSGHDMIWLAGAHSTTNSFAGQARLKHFLPIVPTHAPPIRLLKPYFHAR